MRILFCHPAAEMSVSDVARGMRAALVRQGHVLRDYHIGKRLIYHSRAMGERYQVLEALPLVSQQASETVLLEAMYHRADLVFLVSALIYHPVAIALLKMARVPLVVIHTESPYEDAHQTEWASAYPEAWHCTHERTSAKRLGWQYVPHAYDPEIHKPGPTEPELASDVLFIGTGWPTRIAFFEQVNWTGVNVKLLGLWPGMSADSLLRPYYTERLVQNEDAVRYYRSAKICVNLHRADAGAESLNPRAYELAATGAFTLTDPRAEGVELFEETMPTFTTPQEFGILVRRYLKDPEGRKRCAEQARERVQAATFDARMAALMAAIQPRLQAASQ